MAALKEISKEERALCELARDIPHMPLSAISLSKAWADAVKKLEIIATDQGEDEDWVEDHPINVIFSCRAQDLLGRKHKKFAFPYLAHLAIGEIAGVYKLPDRKPEPIPNSVEAIVKEAFAKARFQEVIEASSKQPSTVPEVKPSDDPIAVAERLGYANPS